LAGDERLRELEEKYEGYTVYDRDGDKIGKVDDLFVDERDREEYIGVKMGLFGLSGTTLIPMEMVRVDEQERVIEVSEEKERVKDAPTYRDDDEVDASFEERIREHFGLQSMESSGERGSYRHSGAASGAAAGAASTRDDAAFRGERGDR
jgi:sporulation protein YlmC with PRC-barrel domain